MYILNRVPSKSMPKTPFELWTNRKPSLNHLKVWGCPAEVRVYNPHERKLDPRTTSGFFIGYPLASKGFRFYCPGHHTRIVESLNAKFLEDHIDSSSSQSSESLSTQSSVDPIILPIMQERIITILVQGEGLDQVLLLLTVQSLTRIHLRLLNWHLFNLCLLGDLREKGGLHCLMTMWFTLVRLIMILGRS